MMSFTRSRRTSRWRSHWTHLSRVRAFLMHHSHPLKQEKFQVSTLQKNHVANVGRSGVLAEEFAELRRDGIEVDNDNDLSPKNAVEPPAEPENVVYNFAKPLFCARRAQNLSDLAGKLLHCQWDIITKMPELDLFQMTMAE